jgi:hypothetical protein
MSPGFTLVPAIHAFFRVAKQDVDARNKSGHDGGVPSMIDSLEVEVLYPA